MSVLMCIPVRWPTSVLFAFTLLCVAGCSSLSTESPGSINLSGIWKLNPAVSDDASGIRAKLSEARKRQAARPQREERPDDKVEVRSRPTRTTRSTSMMEDHPSLLDQGLDALTAKELDIDQRNDSTRIDYDQRELVVYHWGRENRDFVVTESGWQGSEFVIRTELRGGTTIKRSFSLSEDRRMLTVVTKADKFIFTQRYDFDAKTTREVYSGRTST